MYQLLRSERHTPAAFWRWLHRKRLGSNLFLHRSTGGGCCSGDFKVGHGRRWFLFGPGYRWLFNFVPNEPRRILTVLPVFASGEPVCTCLGMEATQLVCASPAQRLFC